MSDRDAFERAFVAVTYLVGRRGELVSGLGSGAGAAAKELADRLGAPDQGLRARALADELLPLVAALQDRGLP